MAWRRAGNLGLRLREVREAVGGQLGRVFTQEEMGELMGLTAQSVSDAENGRALPSRSRLDRLAKALGIPLAVFQEGGPMPSTVPITPPQRHGEPRSPDAPTPDRAALKMLEARLAFLRDSMKAYKDLGQTPGPGILEEWLRVAAADLDPGGEGD